MADVFISYARSTARLAVAAAEALRSAGFSVWYDEELPANRAYADVISEQLDDAKAVLVVWSNEAVSSHWVRSEANRARERGTLVQAGVDGSVPPMPFDQIQCADLRGWHGNETSPAWQRLVGNIDELVHAGEAKHVVHGRAAAGRGFTGWFGRRQVMAGAAAAAIAGGAGIYAFWPRGEYAPPAAAEVLRQKAMAIMQDGRPAEQNQAIAYLTEATRIAPDFATAWGALAITYALRKYQVPLDARAGEEERCRSAARTALRLDADEPFSHCALALLTPTYRNWRAVEDRGRKLVRRIKPIPLVYHLVGDVLVDVGRHSEAVAILSKIDRKQFLIPLSDRSFIQALWNAGNLQLAEELLEEAAERWPQHYAIWNLRTAFLTHTGRAREALALLEDDSTRPVAYPENQLSAALATARALAGLLNPADAIRINLEELGRGSSDVLTYLNRKLSMTQLVAQRCSALGDRDTGFDLLNGYYFGEGRWAAAAPAAGDMDRSTFALFEPPMRNMWRDRRFVLLTKRIGLDRYWQAIETSPDFRAA